MLRTYLVILMLGNGAEIRELSTWEECQFFHRGLRYADAMGGRITVLDPKTLERAAVVGFECRPAENADGTPVS